MGVFESAKESEQSLFDQQNPVDIYIYIEKTYITYI